MVRFFRQQDMVHWCQHLLYIGVLTSYQNLGRFEESSRNYQKKKKKKKKKIRYYVWCYFEVWRHHLLTKAFQIVKIKKKKNFFLYYLFLKRLLQCDFYFCQYLHIGAGVLSFGGDVFRFSLEEFFHFKP